MASGVDPYSTIGDVLDRQAERFAERDALVNVETGERYTYAEFRDEVERVARGLMALGIQRGHHVGIWATNYSEWVLTQFATAKIGAVMVNVNPAYRTHELAYVLGQSEANALISDWQVPQLRLRRDAQRSGPRAERLEPRGVAQLSVPLPEKRNLHPTPRRRRGRGNARRYVGLG